MKVKIDVLMRNWTHLVPWDVSYPYGRRRRGANGRTGARMLKEVNM